MSRICVIIPQYNFSEMTRKCIELCQANAGIDHDILVVDDGSEEAFTSFYDPIPGVNVTRIRKNSGFTAAVNHGILWCSDKYEYIALLNNDTEPRADFLKILVEELDTHQSTAIASSARITKMDGKEIVEGYGLDLIRGYQAIAYDDFKEDRLSILWVPLCSAVIRHSVIRELGLLDKRMRTHCSDNDYCIRAKQMDYEVVLCPRSKVFHHHEVTTKKFNVNPSQDQRILLEKIANLQYADLMTKVPLDAEQKTWGRLSFDVYTK